MGQVLSESDVAPLFADGRKAASERIALLERVLDVDPLVLNLAKLLITKGRTAEASAIARTFGEMVDAQAGVAHAVVTTAVERSGEQLAHVDYKLREVLGMPPDARSEPEPSIPASTVARVGERPLDGIIRTVPRSGR